MCRPDRDARSEAPHGRCAHQIGKTEDGPDTPQGGEVEPSPDALLIRRTLAEIGPVADKMTSYFYALVFTRHPEVRSMFPRPWTCSGIGC
ncbi:hypothetical protein GCM10020254_44160 [Streptomyces goshikiensis]